MFEIIMFVLLLAAGFTAGRVAERRHFASLDAAEREHAGVLVTAQRLPVEALQSGTPAPVLVAGEAVISSDYFKTVISGLKKIIGGEVRSLETLAERARREAIVRMVRQARQLGFDGVACVRIEGVSITGAGKSNGGVITVAAIASGTAYRTTRPAQAQAASPA